MALELFVHPCVLNPPHPLHLPPVDKPLRIRIQGPIQAIQKVLPNSIWRTDVLNPQFPQPAGLDLASLTFKHLYGREARRDIVNDLIVRDEYLSWKEKDARPTDPMDYYGVTFDHLIPPEGRDPEVLALNILENDNDMATYADQWLLFAVDPVEYTGKKVLVVPRCCQKKNGTQDRKKFNSEVFLRSQAVRLPGDTSWSSTFRSLLGYGPRLEIVDYDADMCTLGEEDHSSSFLSLNRTNFGGTRGGTSSYGWPSDGGIWELLDAGVVEFDFLDLPRFNTSSSQRFSEQEDLFCQRLAYIGATNYISEEAWHQIEMGYSSRHHESTVLYGWPGLVPGGGVWALNVGSVTAYDIGISRVQNAITMEERCRVIEMLGGRFYASWYAPKIEVVGERPQGHRDEL